MIWNPWRRIRQMRANIFDLEAELYNARRQCELYLDRYDKIREMNLQLRDTLELYRRADQ